MTARQGPFRTCSAAAVDPLKSHFKTAPRIVVAKIGNFISLRFRYKLLCDRILRSRGQTFFLLIRSRFLSPPGPTSHRVAG